MNSKTFLTVTEDRKEIWQHSNFSPDGRYAVVRTTEGAIQVFSVERDAIREILSMHDETVSGVVCADDKLYFTRLKSNLIYKVDLATGEETVNQRLDQYASVKLVDVMRGNKDAWVLEVWESECSDSRIISYDKNQEKVLCQLPVGSLYDCVLSSKKKGYIIGSLDCDEIYENFYQDIQVAKFDFVSGKVLKLLFPLELDRWKLPKQKSLNTVARLISLSGDERINCFSKGGKFFIQENSNYIFICTSKGMLYRVIEMNVFEDTPQNYFYDEEESTLIVVGKKTIRLYDIPNTPAKDDLKEWNKLYKKHPSYAEQKKNQRMCMLLEHIMCSCKPKKLCEISL